MVRFVVDKKRTDLINFGVDAITVDDEEGKLEMF